MNDDDFSRAVAITLGFEGGYTEDSGGPTKYGISQKSYPDLNIKALTRDQAVEIYFRDYWTRGKCATLPWPTCAIHFDACVNLGVTTANEIRRVSIDPAEFLMHRVARYSLLAENPQYREYLRGWINRVRKLWKLATT